MLVAADEDEWIEVPEYALLEIDEMGKMDPISSTEMRRDWLYTSLGESSDLWIARLPARYDALTIGTGTPLFCKDHRRSEEQTSELQSLMSTSYDAFRLYEKNKPNYNCTPLIT